MSPKETVVMQFQTLGVLSFYPTATSESMNPLPLSLVERQTMQRYLILIIWLHKA